MNLRVFYLTRRGVSDGYGYVCGRTYFFSTLLKKKERMSPIWEMSSLLYFDSFCSNEIIQRLELQLLQLLRQEPQFQQQPS